MTNSISLFFLIFTYLVAKEGMLSFHMFIDPDVSS